MPRTLSELASETLNGMRYYRIVLWVCGPLFGITLFAFILPKISNQAIIGVTSLTVILTEMLVGVFPAKRGVFTRHDVIAGLMGLSMIALTYFFAWSLNDMFARIELLLAISMCIVAVCCFIDRKRFLFYELTLIFLSHLSIIIAALALR